MSQTNTQFLVAAMIVAAFTSVGGVFGVMITMFATISQRTRDIGVLRLLGFRRRQILVSFLLESLLLALLGGLVGCAFGYLADGWTVNSIVSSGQGGGKFVVLKMQVDAVVLSTGMLLALFMGFIGGLIPSLSAMRLSALDALR
jgi:ABC-type antimicrobial peptide transport system permease subunit